MIRQEQCPFLLQFYGAYYLKGTINLVMEHMDCGSIEIMIRVMKQVTPVEQLKTKPLIPEYVISRIAFQILHGIEYLHTERKQLHRDIKPDNILVDSQLGRAKLSDFGISKKLGDGHQNEVTSTYTGTLCYMSPERLDS